MANPELTQAELAAFLKARFGDDLGRIDLETDFEDDLVITVIGLTTSYDHARGEISIVPKSRDFEVEAVLTVCVRFNVTAASQDAAEQVADHVVEDLVENVNLGEPDVEGYSTWSLEQDGRPDGTVNRVIEQ
jgi:hypothetical protein